MANTSADAVIIGSGINAMVAAAELAGAGWSVVVIERNPEIGGFIATEERTAPGYRHDTYSSWHPLFVSGGASASLGADLHRHGLEYRNTDGWLTASVADDGRATLAHRDPERTAARFEHARDRDAYLGALQRFMKNSAPIGALLGGEVRSVRQFRQLAKLLWSNGWKGTERLFRDAATSGRGYCRREFVGTEADHLWVPWLLHGGLSPDHASGGLMIPVFAATMHGFGLPVVAGGAGNLLDAFRALFYERGVEVRTGTEVEQIRVEHGRATGVVAGGEVIEARRAVLASTSPDALYRRLLPDAAVRPRVRDDVARYRPGRAAMQIHVALSAPPAWDEPALAEIPLIHLSDGSASTGIACAEAEAGLLPRRPTVVVGRQDVLDRSRVPDGAAALWLQLQEVPFAPVGDAAGELDTTQGWTSELAAGYADRVLDRVAAHAPGLRESIRAIDVITPADLTAYNPNAVAGDPYGGSAEVDQNFLWRPVPSAAKHATSVLGLWHIGAATHPGPGLGAGSGHIVAQALTRSRHRS